MAALVKSPTDPSGDVLKLRLLRQATFALFIGNRTHSSTAETDCRYYDRLVERQRGQGRRAAASARRSAPTLPSALLLAHAVNVNQRKYCAVDLVIGGAIGANSQGVETAAFVADLFLTLGEGIDHVMQKLFHIRNVDVWLELSYSATDVCVFNVERVAGGRRSTADRQIIVNHYDGQMSAAQEIVQVAVDLHDLEIPVAQFLVQRSQLFVGRLQFFFRRLQFFVGRLQFLVARFDLFVCRFELFVGRFLFFDDGLKRFLTCAEFITQLLDLIFARRFLFLLLRLVRGFDFTAPCFAENHQQPAAVGVGNLERNNFNVYLDDLGVVLYKRPCLARGVACPYRPMNGRANIGNQAWPCHMKQVKSGWACGVCQIGSCPAAKVAHYHIFIDDHSARRVGAEHDPIGHVLNLRIEIASIR